MNEDSVPINNNLVCRVKEGAPNKQFQPLAPGGLEYMGMTQEDGLSSLTLSEACCRCKSSCNELCLFFL